jgi:hypothetical protein
MSNLKKDSKGSAQDPVNNRNSDETAVDERLEKDADEMAGKAAKTEQEYDEDHDIFTK